MSGEASATAATFEGYPVTRLAAPGGRLAALFCPTIGMIGCSLTHDGVELLGHRGGLARYEAVGSTMGIPLLHPWANRLSGFTYTAAGRHVQLDRESPFVRLDQHGLPIHGLLAASPYWSDVRAGATTLTAQLDYGAHPELLEGFPFPHLLTLRVTIDDGGLEVSTALAPTGETAVPVSFGFHPYLQLPDVPRAEWEVEIPTRTRMVLDERQIPTGESEAADIAPGPLGERTFDDAFCDLPHPPVFTLSGGGRRIRVRFLDGYAFAQVYAPPDQDVICFEPMTAATNALVAGGPGLNLVAPGETYSASFRIDVAST